MRTTTRLLVPLLLVGLAAAACGGDDDDDTGKKDDSSSSSSTPSSSGSASEDDYVAALAADMDESDAFGDAETNECVARAMVQSIGAGSLEEADVTPQALADADTLEELGVSFDGDALWARGNDCVDLGRRLVLSAAQGDEAVAQCVMDATTEEERKALFVSTLEGEENIDAEAATAIGAALQVCTPTATTGG